MHKNAIIKLCRYRRGMKSLNVQENLNTLEKVYKQFA